MPVPLLKNLAKQTGKSLSTAEKYWEEAKISASKKFNKKDNRYWAYVTSLVKKRMNVNESLSFKEFLDKEIILESIPESNIQKIKQNCSKFIKESGGKPAFRGMKREPFFYTKTRSVSVPRDSSDLLSSSLNLYLEQKFGYKAIRSLNRIYVAGDAPQLKQYGNLYYVFPFDDYKFVWSEDVQDATSDVDRNVGKRIIAYLEQSGMNEDEITETFRTYSLAISKKDGVEISDIKDEKFFKPIMSALDEAFDEYNYQNKNLERALESGNEITIQTPGFYSLPCIEEPDYDEAGAPIHMYWSDVRKKYKEIYERLK